MFMTGVQRGKPADQQMTKVIRDVRTLTKIKTPYQEWASHALTPHLLLVCTASSHMRTSHFARKLLQNYPTNILPELFRVEDQKSSWDTIVACYDKATDLPFDLQTNDCAADALKSAHKKAMEGCPDCDYYAYCEGNMKANECKDGILSSLGIGDKENTIEKFDLCIEESYSRGTQKSFDAKVDGQKASSIAGCDKYLEPEGCIVDAVDGSLNCEEASATNSNSSCSSKIHFTSIHNNISGEPDERCSSEGGYCMKTTNCPGANYVDNKCPGDESNKCCLSAPFQVG